MFCAGTLFRQAASGDARATVWDGVLARQIAEDGLEIGENSTVGTLSR